ncbi:hypothetical protein [Pseudonocardia lacus]|uniref:hypothetical protein n=1 Tax=Pseudonocardia lacus TaxID=2835865 RepID=UPI001BDC280E|nr:hypothetical protein [Pseudonocardia lacus]
MPPEESAPGPEIPEHPLLNKLVADSDNPDLTTLRGYVRRSTAPDVITLYPSLDDLSVHIDVTRADVVQFTEPTDTEPPLTGTTLWVRKDATVTVRSAVRVTAGELRNRLRRPGAAAGPTGEAGEKPDVVRAGRLVIQRRGPQPLANSCSLICTSNCELCGSFCNCATFCFTVPQ